LLPSIGAAAEIATHEVGIAGLKRHRTEDGPRQNPTAEPGSEAPDLSLDAIGHVRLAAVRHMAVGPGGVFAERSARWVESRMLRYEHEWLLRGVSRPDCPLAGGDLFRGAT
jgi:hypothetical protein